MSQAEEAGHDVSDISIEELAAAIAQVDPNLGKHFRQPRERSETRADNEHGKAQAVRASKLITAQASID